MNPTDDILAAIRKRGSFTLNLANPRQMRKYQADISALVAVCVIYCCRIDGDFMHYAAGPAFVRRVKQEKA